MLFEESCGYITAATSLVMACSENVKRIVYAKYKRIRHYHT